MPSDEFPPDDRTLRWCARALDPTGERTRVRSSVPLVGGLGGTTHLLSFEREGVVRRAVLQRQIGVAVDEGDFNAAADVLLALSQRKPDPATNEIWPATPELLAVDASAAATDAPALLMSFLPGRPDYSVQHLSQRLKTLGHALATLHRDAPPCPSSVPRFDPLLELLPNDDIANWSIIEPRLRQRLACVEHSAVRLIHGDYHQGNTLFEGTTLSGVVDWSTARLGPPEWDVALCSMDLALLYGLDASDHFTGGYAEMNSAPLREQAVWRLLAASKARPAQWVVAWEALGCQLSVQHVVERLNAFVERDIVRF